MSESRKWQIPFFTIWSGQAVSLTGSALVQFGIAWWLTEETGSAVVLSTAYLMGLLPGVILGPAIGALVDRWRRRWVMVVADSAIALFTGLLAWLYLAGVVQLWHVYVVLLLRAVGTAFHDPAMSASTSLMVPKEQLTRVGGMNHTLFGVTRIVAPMLGAVLISRLSLGAVLAIDVVTALVAVVPLLFIDVPDPEPAPSKPGRAAASRGSFLGDMMEGLRYVWSWPGLAIVLLSWSATELLANPIRATQSLLFTEHFGGGAEQFGLAASFFGVGTILGGMLMTAWKGFGRRMHTMYLGLLLLAMADLFRGLAPRDLPLVAMVGYAIHGPGMSMVGVPFRATLQSSVDPGRQGRVFALMGSLAGLTGPVGLVAIAPLVESIGVQPLFRARGAVYLATALIWLLVPAARNLEDGPPVPSRPRAAPALAQQDDP